jgi:hypothetical protein
MKTLGIALAVVLAGTVVAQEPATASLEGIVVHSETNAPLSGARVELRTDTGMPVGVNTDDDGKFSFPNIKAGRYRVLTSLPGFARAEYGRRTGAAAAGRRLNMVELVQFQALGGPDPENPPPVSLAIETGLRLTGLRIVMTPGGVITGKVMDRGRPVGTHVSAVMVSYDAAGQVVLKKILMKGTTDLGEYHLFWLPPGRYYVMADLAFNSGVPPPTWHLNPTDGFENPLISRGNAGMWVGGGPEFRQIPFLRSGGDSGMRVPKFSPGTPDWRNATVIDVTPGAEIRNVDIDASAVPALHVRGTVNGIQQGHSSRISLFKTGIVSTQAYASTNADSNGSFDLAGIPPGSYLLRASAFAPTARGLNRGTANTQGISDLIDGRGLAAGTNVGISALVEVEVRDRDVSGVSLVLDPGVAVSGRVVSEQANLDLSTVTVRLQAETGDAIASQVRPAADGSFTLSGVAPNWNYRVFVNPFFQAPGRRLIVPPQFQGLYVKSVSLGNEDVLNNGLRLGSQPTRPLTITVAAAVGSVSGRVLGPQPVAATVVLIPESGQRFHAPHPFTYTGESGRFEITQVRPGDYKLYAWESVEPFAWQNADFMRNYESQGKLVHIDENARVTGIELNSIP